MLNPAVIAKAKIAEKKRDRWYDTYNAALQGMAGRVRRPHIDEVIRIATEIADKTHGKLA